jgi:UDP-2,3-diacylglucosamine pyrophosphatase LpxH
MSTGSNLLVVSDLHLGGSVRVRYDEDNPDIKPTVPFGALRRAARLDRELARFINYYRAEPASNGRPWRLVFNGDIFDFLHMDVHPLETDSGGVLNEDEKLHGLAFDANRSAFKLEVMARLHQRSLTALTNFVHHGNELVFVVGNHDVDLWFRQVREKLVDHLVEGADDAQGVRSRIRFEPWFYYEAGCAYVEHGHRFDPYATFPDPLKPLAADQGTHLAPNFGHFGLRYFCNRVRSFPVHDLDHISFIDVMRWIRRHPPWYVLKAAGRFAAFVYVYARAAVRDRLHREKYAGRNRANRRARIRKFADRSGLPLSRVLALDRLRRPPVGATLGRLAQALLLDLIGITILTVVGMVAAFWIWDGLVAWGAAAATFGVGLLVERWAAQTRPALDIHPIHERMARRIGRLTGVAIVVFGHTHRPVLQRVGMVDWLNPGSWEHLPSQRVHGANEPCDCDSRFGLIQRDLERPRANLMRWCRRHRSPLPVVQAGVNK